MSDASQLPHSDAKWLRIAINLGVFVAVVTVWSAVTPMGPLPSPAMRPAQEATETPQSPLFDGALPEIELTWSLVTGLPLRTWRLILY
jgi:hypothetical protein